MNPLVRGSESVIPEHEVQVIGRILKSATAEAVRRAERIEQEQRLEKQYCCDECDYLDSFISEKAATLLRVWRMFRSLDERGILFVHYRQGISFSELAERSSFDCETLRRLDLKIQHKIAESLGEHQF